MANKKLKVGGASDLKLPTKKSKDDKKPKWQWKKGEKKGQGREVIETQEVVADDSVPVLEQAGEVPAAETTPVEVAPFDIGQAELATTETTPEATPTDEPTRESDYGILFTGGVRFYVQHHSIGVRATYTHDFNYKNNFVAP